MSTTPEQPSPEDAPRVEGDAGREQTSESPAEAAALSPSEQGRTTTQPAVAPPSPQQDATREAGTPPSSWREGRSGLILALLMAAFSTYLLYGIVTMDVADNVDQPGPAFFPAVLMVAGYILAALLALATWRNPEPVDREGRATYSNFGAVGWCVAGFVIFALSLEFLGWVLAAAVLFWCVARGIGSRRPLFDVSVALVVSSIIYLIFRGVLGLNLPPGILAGVL